MTRVGIIGATGFTGEELLKILQHHSGVTLEFVTSERQAGSRLSEVFPGLTRYHDMQFITGDQALQKKSDLVFLCLPAGDSSLYAREFYEKGTAVIDLGADFRFDRETDYERWYHIPHKTPELLEQAVYGLPEWNREDISESDIIGNPGCYPTSALLPLLPLFREGLIKGQVIIDAKSGVSGAGRKLKAASQFTAVNENLSPYNAGRMHRHVGEMERQAALISGVSALVTFTPHLLPVTRGMMSTIYCTLTDGSTPERVNEVYDDYYTDEPFVHVIDSWPNLHMVQHSNHCFIGFKQVE